MPDHADAEAALAATGLAFTSLRNGFYAATAAMLLDTARRTGELVAPPDGPVSWTRPPPTWPTQPRWCRPRRAAWTASPRR